MKEHEFFKGIEWEDVKNRHYEMPKPYVKAPVNEKIDLKFKIKEECM